MASFSRRVWDRQPSGPTSVDWANPLARDLVHLWVNGYDYAQKVLRGPSDAYTTRATGQEGSAFLVTSSASSQIGVDLGSAMPTTGPLTYSALTANTATSDQQYALIGSTVSSGTPSAVLWFDSWSANDTYWCQVGGVSTEAIIPPSQVLRFPHLVSFTYDATASLCRVKLDKQPIATTTGAAARTAATTNTSIGGMNGWAWTAATAYIFLAAAWKRSMTPSEIEQWHRNPWQLFLRDQQFAIQNLRFASPAIDVSNSGWVRVP